MQTVSRVEKSFRISFELFITEHTPEDNRCVLHMTKGGASGKIHGDRIPLVYLYAGGTLGVRTALNGKANHAYDGNKRFSNEEWYKIIIEQVFIGAKVRLSEVY